MSRDKRYDRFKKNKSSSLRNLRHKLEYRTIRFFQICSNLFSIRNNQRFGSMLGRLVYHFARKDRGIADYQLEFCFPELNCKERLSILKQTFSHAAITLLETLNVKKFREDPNKWIRLKNRKIVKEALLEGKGAVFVFGHLGNWELLPIVYEMLQIEGIAIDSPIGEKKLDEILLECRYSTNIEMIPRGDKRSARSILKCFRNNGVMLFALDQDMYVKSVFVDFFGRKASTAQGAANMARKFEVPVLSAFGMRREDGTHEYNFQLLSAPPYAKGDKEIVNLTQIYTTAIENQIRNFPSQWVWFHRRWKTQPDSLVSDQSHGNNEI